MHTFPAFPFTFGKGKEKECAEWDLGRPFEQPVSWGQQATAMLCMHFVMSFVLRRLDWNLAPKMWNTSRYKVTWNIALQSLWVAGNLEILEHLSFWWLENLETLEKESFWSLENKTLIENQWFWSLENLEVLGNQLLWSLENLEILKSPLLSRALDFQPLFLQKITVLDVSGRSQFLKMCLFLDMWCNFTWCSRYLVSPEKFLFFCSFSDGPKKAGFCMSLGCWAFLGCTS